MVAHDGGRVLTLGNVQDSIPTWVSPVRDDKGEWIVSHIINQDIVGWASQGRIADRSHENLRSSDIGITMMRKRFFEDLDRIVDDRASPSFRLQASRKPRSSSSSTVK